MQNNYNPDVLSCLANLSSDEVFTPPKLANEILDLLPKEIWKDKNATFLDPVCKSGVFLREIARRLLDGLKQEIPDVQKRINHIYKNQLFGIGITELTSLLSRRSLYCSKSANGKYSVSSTFNNEQGNIFFEKTEHDWKNGRCSFCGASQSEYQREEGLETHAYQFIHNKKPNIINNMKFDVIIGNPPYQLSTGGSGVQATPLYHKFVLQAKKLNPRFLVMITPARWFSGGFGLDAFRNEMLNDNRLRFLHDYPEANDCFPGVQIKGGVCYFLWDRDNPGTCSITTHRKDNIGKTIQRSLLEEGNNFFVRYNEAISILRKVRTKEFKSFDKLVSPQKPFGLPTTYRGKKEKDKGDVTLYENGGVAYIARNKIKMNEVDLDKFKVFISPAGSGSDKFPHTILGKPFLGKLGTACTETYIYLGPFNNEKECLNIISYVYTRFFRFLVMLKKPTQHALRNVYSLVPIQNWSEPWTDEKLYKKYKLTKEEIEFIESMIRPMQ